MRNFNFPILSSIMLMPLMLSPIFFIVLQSFDILPAWLQSDILSSNFLLAVIVSIIFFIFFSYHERKIKKFDSYSKSNFVFVLVGFVISLFFFDIDFREIAQSLGLNIVFSFLSLFFLAVLIPKYKPWFFGVFLCLLAGFWFGSSGSKASIFSIILLWVICSGNHSFKYFLYIFLGICFIALIDFNIFLRYMDVGLSMINSMQVCEYSEKSLMEYYYDALSQYIISGSTFNPVMTFYYDAGLASAGYNVTPTVIGDIICRPENFLFALSFVIFYIHFSLNLGYKLFNSTPWINNFHILVFLIVMSSSTFDIFKFEIIFWFIGFSYLILKTYIDRYINNKGAY